MYQFIDFQEGNLLPVLSPVLAMISLLIISNVMEENHILLF